MTGFQKRFYVNQAVVSDVVRGLALLRPERRPLYAGRVRSAFGFGPGFFIIFPTPLQVTMCWGLLWTSWIILRTWLT